MKIIKNIIKCIHIFIENIFKEEDFQQDFWRNYSEHYTYQSRKFKKSI